MFVAVSSPWSANDAGDPLVVIVEAPDKESATEILGRALAMEAYYAGSNLSDEDLEALLSTISFFD